MDATMTDASGSGDSSADTVRSDGSSVEDDDRSDDLAGGTDGEHHGTIANLNEEEVPADDEDTDWWENADFETEVAISRLNRHSLDLDQAFDGFFIIACSDNEFDDHGVALQSWRECWRLFNTMMFLFHGKGKLDVDSKLFSWRSILTLDPPRDVSDRLGDDMRSFAGDASIGDENDLRYRFPVRDPTVSFWEMHISNLGMPHDRRFQRNQTGNHAGSIRSPDYANMVVSARHWAEESTFSHESTARTTTCPWARLNQEWQPCGPRCRAVAREQEWARARAGAGQE